jgi:hypothetical protein
MPWMQNDNPLEEAMLERVPQSATEFAMLAIIELRYAEKNKNPKHPSVGS